MSCCWSYWPQAILRRPVMVGSKIIILPKRCLGACPHHREGQHSSTLNYKYPQQDRHLRAQYMGLWACTASMGPPAACLHSTQPPGMGFTPRFLPSVNLPEEPECLLPCGPYQSCHQKSCSSQAATTGSTPNQNLRRVCPWSMERLDAGWIEPPGSKRLAWGGATTNQGANDQMGTPVFPQWPGPRKDITNET